jgi:RimJ/RimL family protein N-acetyltransferase
MGQERPFGGTIRKLWPTETDAFRDHLLRLDKTNRRNRFAHAVSDGFIGDYASRMADNEAVLYGYFDGAELRAVAELRKIGGAWGDHAEAAFSVETAFQEQGIATELLGRVIRSARNRGVRHLIMCCLADNAKMQAVARHHEADLRFEAGEVIGDIVPELANPLSMFAEAVEDRMGFLLAVFDLQSRISKRLTTSAAA